jgi:hypothetical protein
MAALPVHQRSGRCCSLLRIFLFYRHEGAVARIVGQAFDADVDDRRAQVADGKLARSTLPPPA